MNSQTSQQPDFGALERVASEVVEPEQRPDSLDLEEERQLKYAYNQIALRDAYELIGTRKKIGETLRHFLWAAFAFSVVATTCSGLNVGWFQYFSLPPEVLVTLFGTTAVSALGAVGAVAAGLFRIGKKKNDFE
ncbi:MAG: hypothetical protein ACX939_09285 [Hyphococcus sp.]